MKKKDEGDEGDKQLLRVIDGRAPAAAKKRAKEMGTLTEISSRGDNGTNK